MKPKLNCVAPVTTSAPALRGRRHVPALSLQKTIRQAPSRTIASSFPRLPALPTNRVYLKALREAEMAAWESAPAKVQSTPTPKQVTPRLPSTPRDRREGWLYAVLTSLCATLLGNELWTAFQAAGNWHNFVQYVRALLT